MPSVHLIIRGKVQGVFFRASAKKEAERLSITGWVKNTDEGNVEAIATGAEENLNRFVIWCGHGPSNAKVTSVERTDVDAPGTHEFLILR